MKTNWRHTIRGMSVAVLAVGAITSCASLNKSEQGAIIGAAAGGVAGGVIGNNNGSTTKGAIIGAVIGGAAGAIIGHQMDKQAQELSQSIPGATVERVGEGIQITFDSGLLFDFDSDTIKGAAQSNLNNLAANLTKYDPYGGARRAGAGHDEYKRRWTPEEPAGGSRDLRERAASGKGAARSGGGLIESLAVSAVLGAWEWYSPRGRSTTAGHEVT